MTIRLTYTLAVAAAVVLGSSAPAQAKKALIAPPARPGDLVAQADTVVQGKIVEVDKGEVMAAPYPGAPKDQAVAFKVAVLKVEDTLLGGQGLTQFRVGFPADAAPVPAGRGRGPTLAPVALTAGQEGCFLLVRHHAADFYILVPNSKPLSKTDKADETDLTEVKKSAKAIEDPVAALKAKDLADRFWAGYVLLQKYTQAKPGKSGRRPARELVPAEENKLLVQLMAELPWLPSEAKAPLARGGPGQPPSRMALWGFVNTAEIGFGEPKIPQAKPGTPAVDYNKVLDEATAKFLKEKGDKVVLKRYAAE